MEEKKKLVKKISVLGVEVQEDNRLKGVCKRIIFSTDIGRVTFSPKDIKASSRVNKDGLTITSIERENMLIADLPEILVKINSVVAENGSCNIKCKITEWKTVDQQAEPITYLFFSTLEDFNNIEIL